MRLPFRNPLISKMFILSLEGLLVAAGLALILGGVFFIGLFMLTAKPAPTTYAIALGDLNADGRLDAFYANGQDEGPRPNTVLLNGGGGKLIDSGQRLGQEESSRVTLADLDGDADLDAWVANIGYNSTFINDGQAHFSAGQSLFENELIGSAQWSIALGDLDGDGDPDALGGGCCGASASFGDGTTQLYRPFNQVWLNQGDGRPGFFSAAGQSLESLGAEGVALGDLNGDGRLDAFFANTSIMNSSADLEAPQPNTVFWNDGRGNLIDSGQRLGLARSTAVALGDLDGDGDLDSFVTNQGASEVWLNAGGQQAGQPGTFIDSGQRLGSGMQRQIFLARLDDDSDLDAAIVVQDGGFVPGYHLEIWLNDGQAGFSDSGQSYARPPAQAFALGDLNGDGQVDILAGWYPADYAIWWNQGSGQFAR